VKFLYLATLASLSVAGSVLLQAQTSYGTVSALPPSTSEITAAAQRVATEPVTARTLNVYTMPTLSPEAATTLVVPPRAMPLRPLRTKPSSQINAPAASPLASTLDKSRSTSKGFNGMANSPTICPYFGGCQPPDMALAASPKYVLQGVNTSFALYSTSGKLLAGPVNAQSFFGVPDPAPFGCDPAGPFLSDPRAFYDPNTGRFWVALLQVEDSPPIGVHCHFQSAYWIANLDPVSGTIHIYRFDMALGTTNNADYTQFGFNAHTVSFTGNMFNQEGTAYVYAEAQFADKQAMEAGDPVTPIAFTHLSADGVLLDTVQPVETETPVGHDPGVQYLLNAFNINGDPFGDDCFNTACHGFVVWAYDPARQKLSAALAESGSYVVPPNADEPGCTQCIETIDTRITGTPVYSVGAGRPLISFGIGTALFNGTETVAGILWGQIQPTLSGGSVTGGSIYQSGRIVYPGDRAVSFPAVMQDINGNLFMVFDTMSHTLNPSIMVTKRLKTDPLGTLQNPILLKHGLNLTLNSRWGDYEATSYDGFSTNHVWVASQYSGINGDWATFISQQPPLLTIPSATLSDGTIGAAYTQTIQATGGVAPFNWTVSAGTLPHGLGIGSSSSNVATISGTPDIVQTGVAFTIRVTDASGQSAAQSYSVNIKSTVAQTQSGAVQGVVEGNELAFRGIPYAAPPVGNLRWQPPRLPITWTGTRDASSFGNICPQLNANNQPIGTEDCLFLNIFISSQSTHGQQQPVMVYIHGGSNRIGGTHQPFLNTPPLATQGVIVVTIEYRLGMLGFFVNPLLTAEGAGSSGNYGLMDQIAALTWVQQNITAFGGDPTHVMVFGQSAGSFDVQMLLTSPVAQGLFWTAGMESGSLLHGQVLTLAALEPLESPLVSLLGCDTAPDVLACLRAAPAANVVNNESAIPTIPGGFRSRTLAIEPHVLPVDPFDALQQNGSPVPLLIGSTREEASGGSLSDDPTVTPPLDEAGYEAALHAEFDPIGAGVAKKVLDFYPARHYDAPVYALIAVDSDFQDICEDRNVARTAVRANGPSVWRYLYTHRYENDTFLNTLRAFHTAELPFVFGSPQLIFGGPYTPSAAELTFASQMMGYWSRFAKTGDPNGMGATSWPHYDSGTDAMLQLDERQAVINGYHNRQCDYLLPLLP
jgi:para-nitrobenzyl esterase